MKTLKCWICNSTEGELKPSLPISDDSWFHDACAEKHRAETITALDALIEFVEESLEPLEPWYVRAWKWYKRKTT